MLNKVTNLFWLLLIIVTLISCGRKETSTMLTGKLPASPNSNLMFVPIENYFPGLESDEVFASVETDSIGNFIFKTSQLESGYYQLVDPQMNYSNLKYDIYMEPGDSIHIEQSLWNEEPHLLISGRGSEKLNYLMLDYQIFPKSKSFYNKIRSNSFETEHAFKSFIDSIQNIRISKLISNKSTPENLKTHFKNVIYTESAKFLLDHLERRNYYMKEEPDYYYPDSSYYSFLKNINFDNSFCQSEAAKSFAESFLTSTARIAFKEKDEDWWKENLSWKLNYVSSQPKSIWTDLLALSTIRDYSFGLMEDTFSENLSTFDEKMENLFSTEANRQLYKNNVLKYFSLATGMPAPDFALPDSSGNIIRLSDFKGKVVYVDFWGTWCYPCIKEIPDALELQIKYKESPVVFLYVALEYDENNIADWKKFIAGKNKRFGKFLNNKPFPGVHLVAEKQFNNESIKPYKLSFVPTHVLIDQDGNLVSSRAERSKGIAEQLDKLLEGIKNEYHKQ